MNEQKTTTQYYLQVLDGEAALVRAVSLDDNGMEVSYSDHSSDDESAADGDGSLCAPDWEDGRVWEKLTKAQAERKLGFQFDDEEKQ